MTQLTFSKLRVPSHAKSQHIADGGYKLRLWAAYLPNGEVVRVMGGLEPIGKNQLAQHLSVSIGKSANENEPSCRPVTDAEFQSALTLVPGMSWTEYPTNTLVRHAYSA